MPTRVFLPSHLPLLEQIVNRLLPDSGSGPLRMEDTWIIAPTKQAGRRLRETLTQEWRKRGGTALLGLEVHSPSSLFQAHQPDNVAHAFDWMACWQQILIGREPGSLPALMPQLTEPMDASMALSFGQRLQRLRDELFDAELDLGSVATSPLLSSEQERWTDLASLEQAYRAALEAQELVDPVDAKRQALADFTLPQDAETLVLAAVPDPSPIILKRLEKLDRDIHCEVWIHADEKDASLFTEWGVPTDAWRDKPIGTGKEPEGWIECLADPSSILARMKELCDPTPEHPDLGLGLLDTSLTAPISNLLEGEGKSLYDPSPVSLEKSSIVRMLQVFAEHRKKNDPESLRALWRQPAVLRALRPEAPMNLLEEWEHFASETFPGSSEAVDTLLKSGPLRSAWERLKGWAEQTTASGWLEMLREIYRDQTLDPKNSEDRYTLRQVKAVADILQEAIRREEQATGPNAGILLQALANESVDPLRVDGTFTAEGWLELPYHPGDNLLLIGLQEGIVPPPPPQDPLLPLQVREELGLKSDRDWLARDTYLFHTMICSRSPGNVRVWVMKRARDGSPLMPSRLLFACDDQEFLKRADLLFSPPPPPPAIPPPEKGISLDPTQAPHRTLDRLSVSDINTYLTCPTRFYLQVVLGMRTTDDQTTEPDAATFGTLIHKVLEKTVQAGPCSETEWKERCEATLHSVMTHHLGPLESMSLRVLEHSALKRLTAAGRVQQDLWNEGWESIAFETKLVRPCNGVDIVGKVDRIDRHPEKGLRIIDFKTSDSPAKPEAAHLGPPRAGRESIQLEVEGKTRQWNNLQLPLYRWLATPTYPNESLEVAYFNLPSAVSDTALSMWDKEAGLAKEAETCLENILQLIQDGVWHPTTTMNNPWDPFGTLLLDGSEWVPTSPVSLRFQS